MRILQVLTYYHPHWTGLTAHAVRVAEGLAARGHRVTVLTSRHTMHLPRDEMVNGVRVVRLAPAGRITRGMVMPSFPWAAASLIAQHDVVQMHTPMMESLLVALLCRALGRPLLMTHHGDLIMPEGLLNRVVERTVTTMMIGGGRLASRVSAYSRDYADHSAFLQKFAGKLTYIYPPVEIPEPQPQAVANWRRELGLEGKRLVGFAGRFVEEKGFDYLLRAMPLVRQRVPEAHFIFAGEHRVAYENFYQKCLPLIKANSANLTFLGLIRDPQRLANFYALCDVFTLPSRTDCLAIVQVESALCGTPLVTSDIPGARVVVHETGGGVLVRPRSPEALADGLCQVLADPARYRRTRREVRLTFDTERTIDQYEATLADIRGQRERASGLGQAAAPAERPGAAAGADRCLLAKVERLLRNESDVAYRRRAKLVIEYLDLHPGERVLDCGCGMGFYLSTMAGLDGARLVGYDGDERALAFAQRQLAGRGVSLVRGDIQRLGFPDGAFDKIICSEVLEHLADDAAGLRELWRVLRPGGILAITVPNAQYPFVWDPINRVLENLSGRHIQTGPLAGIWALHRRLYTRGQLEALVRSAGFAVEDVRWLTHYCFPFSHNIVYGIGKPLIQRRLLPDFLAKSADRFRSQENTGSRLNPVNWALGVFNLVDRLNDRPGLANNPHAVNVTLKARKPA